MEDEIQENTDIVEYTMGAGTANLYAFLMVFPILLVTLLPFSLIWGYSQFEVGKRLLSDYFIVILIAGVIVHEFLHGITWAVFASKGFKSIKFGIKWSWLTPYCHCKEPLKAKHYRLGGVMPLIVMGLLPLIIGMIAGNGFLFAFGIFFSWAAGGDIISLIMLRNLKSDVLVYDHPHKMGFYIIKEKA
jgi:hypothetical protein